MVMGELKDIVAEEIKKLARIKAEEQQQQGQGALMTVDAQSQKIEQELSQYVQYAKRRCREGFDCCIEAVRKEATLRPDFDLQAFDDNINQAFSRFDSTVYVLEMSTKASRGTSWKELLGLTDSTMTTLYDAARSHFDQGHIPEAEAAFYFLTTVDVTQYAFWLGLGHAAFRLGNFNQSLNAYETAACCQENAVWPEIYIANCYESMNDYFESLQALERAFEQLKASGIQDKELETALIERIARDKARI